MLFVTRNSKLILAYVLILGSSVASTTEEECVDKHAIKVQCKEWAWFGEWYVD